MKSREADSSLESVVKAVAERQDALERGLGELASAVKRLESRLDVRLDARTAERSDEPEFSAQEGAVEALNESAPGAASTRKHGVKAEVKAVIAAAAAVAGEMAKVRQVRPVPTAQDSGSAWSQQGRVGVAGSHNLR